MEQPAMETKDKAQSEIPKKYLEALQQEDFLVQPTSEIIESEEGNKKKDSEEINEIIILGMHHSATSLTSRLVMMFGAYGGETSELLFHPDPLLSKFKFWERKDVIQLNQNLFRTFYQETNALNNRKRNSKKLIPWAGYGFTLQQIQHTSLYSNFHAQAAPIIQKLNQNRPWVTKEPRMCLTLPLWVPLFDKKFVCVLVYRNPLSLATSLSRYSGLSLNQWINLWENYTVSALSGCKNQLKFVVKQDDLGQNPFESSERLYSQLKEIAKVPRLTFPQKQDILQLLKPNGGNQTQSGARIGYQKKLYSEKELTERLSPIQKCLTQFFEREDMFLIDSHLKNICGISLES